MTSIRAPVAITATDLSWPKELLSAFLDQLFNAWTAGAARAIRSPREK